MGKFKGIDLDTQENMDYYNKLNYGEIEDFMDDDDELDDDDDDICIESI